jgi:hypothetical protein
MSLARLRETGRSRLRDRVYSPARRAPARYGASTDRDRAVAPQLSSACVCDGGCPRCSGDVAFQAKLEIGLPGDKYEQEADRVADQVMRIPAPTVQRKPGFPSAVGPSCGDESAEEELIQQSPLAGQITPLVQRQSEEEDEEEEPIQLRRSDGKASQVSPNLQERIRSLGGGQPLQHSLRTFYEPRFGRDLSHVRVHTDAEASGIAETMNAKAFTIGRDVVFGAGQYAPGSVTGKKLLAHELTHVVQQGDGALISTSPRIQRYTTDCTGNDEIALEKAHKAGLAQAQKAISMLGGHVCLATVTGIDPEVLKKVREWFHTDWGPKAEGYYIGQIVAVLTCSLAGARGKLKYECDSGLNPGCLILGAEAWTCCDCNIHLCPDFFLSPSGHTLVHEWTHKFVNTDDVMYYLPPAGDPTKYRTSLTPDKAIINGPSYGYFLSTI